ncbi:phospholipase [Methylovorus sp. MM2]|uniref:phospholipase A n=1 Tax=Methylovorus sp. MM2 TaxID=1848038 RepID=UPI0007DE99E6|nr:phospholipase A [Methylovorus sp. MM2]OAM53035.1 phospholipase [Methylovorus sp. MM2]
MKNRTLGSIYGLLMMSITHASYSADRWIIASNNELVGAGKKISLETVKPSSLATWPEKLKLKLSANGLSEEIELTLAAPTQANDVRRIYEGNSKESFAGVVKAELVGETSNPLIMLAEAGGVPPQAAASALHASPVAADAPEANGDSPTIVLAKPGEEPPLSSNEPIYFLMGSNSERGTDARFQISFKYRPFDPKGSMAGYAPFLSNVYFAYTQTTIWDIGGDSSPFEDTTYRPSLFYKWDGSGQNIWPAEWRAGVEHESNGQAGLDSRSLNIAFVRPTWNIDFENGKRLSFLPKIYQYIEKDDNSDIQKYRGYADWQLRYGREDGLIVSGLYRQGTRGYSTGQVDMSYPISDRLFGRTGTFVHLQLFSGYGETLLDYNQDRDTQLRIGLSVAR